MAKNIAPNTHKNNPSKSIKISVGLPYIILIPIEVPSPSSRPVKRLKFSCPPASFYLGLKNEAIQRR